MGCSCPYSDQAGRFRAMFVNGCCRSCLVGSVVAGVIWLEMLQIDVLPEYSSESLLLVREWVSGVMR